MSTLFNGRSPASCLASSSSAEHWNTRDVGHGQLPVLRWGYHRNTTFFTASAYFISLACTTILYRLSPWHPLASYPGPLLWRMSSMRLSYDTFCGRRSRTLHQFHAKYGPFVRIGPNILSINSPSGASIYTAMEKSDSYRFPSNDGVVAMFFKQDTKDLHRERKRIWNGLFSPSGLAQLVPSLEQRTWELLQCLERRQSGNGGWVDIPEAFYHWSHDLTGDIVFSGCNELELMNNGDPHGIINAGKMANAVHESFGQSPWLLELVRCIPIGREVHGFVGLAAEMTRNRLKAVDLPPFRDLMSYLIEAGVQTKDLERDAIVAILGASDNTPVMLALACYYLTAEPRCFRKLRKELEQVFADPLGPMPLNTLSKLPVLNGVIEEVLRLNSPYFMPRVVPPGGTHLDGHYIPENTIVALAPHLQHTDPENFFPEPLSFRPERWMPQGLGPYTRTNKSVLASFSFGPHACIGKTLAYHEMRYVLSRMALIYDMEFAPGFDCRAFRSGIVNMRTTYMKTPLRMKLIRRPGIEFEALLEKLS
ncbi:cytochrome P450 [Dichomitus squalens LYAD-421 SS1]|uniref:Cytochrome P450 n=1 Tax=Dichomitus squalens (strain LYAD-421) TaxID=732165 RepID=R7SKI1_DICSQ|nr:cytochrome P450 [Dichomitus squalens LYAD-421 SS1]EJF56220.1 cytochrome P450 [Dichomitus squalens LYAD-421 SS1]